ncbi:MAG TPA: xanthine dehydrogenase family protein molybdopterin-binding subunit [Pseudolabrys sp.]|nr:xanthine dehydrogenase family protein molybdopterin-binding subunit [Pseudolabrys sp.]
MSEKKQKYIGRSVPRLEDRPLLKGQGRFAADISFPGQLHMRVVRSPVAFGKLLYINASAARTHPGVHAVWTFDDVAHIPAIGFRLTGLKELEPYRQHVLARGYVRYVGEPVAVVFAENQYAAEDAADLVDLEIEQARATLDATGEPGAFDEVLNTEPGVLRKGYGDIDTAFRNAHAVVSLELSIGRHTGVPIETRGAIARYDGERDVLEMHGAAKVPHWNRDQIAQLLGRKKESVQLYEGHVGGGFGIRGELYPEDVLVCAAALKFKRPVKWIEDRREHLIAANHSRQQHHKVRAAIDAQGHILGIEDEFFHDNGAYMRTHAATVPDLAAAMLPGPYRVPAYRAIGHIRLTNKTPCGTYRAPGRYETTFVRERLLDAIAAKTGIDPIEIRRRNLIDSSAMPYRLGLDTLGTEIIYDSGDYARLLDKALTSIEWDALQDEMRARRSKGEKVGAGLAIFVEKSGLGPFDKVRIEVAPEGSIEVITGVASIGQGIETVVAQICADTLGVDYARVRVTHGQTDRIDKGMGAFASRVTVMCGEATRLAATKLREKALAAAAELMQKNAAELTIIDGQIRARDQEHGPSMSLGDVARAHKDGLTAEDQFDSAHMVYPYGVHVAMVAVDGATGAARVERYLVAYDIGKAVNPMLVEGQICGGVVQGIGGALFEEFLYDENGEPLSVTFADYLMPTAHETPVIRVVLSEDAPSPLNPLGLKGAGEAGINAVGAAIASAIDDALGIPGAVTRLPISPQRLGTILKSGWRSRSQNQNSSAAWRS